MKEIDQKVLDLLAKVKQKKSEIGAAERPRWETNCSFGFSEDLKDRVNIQVLSDLKDLVGIVQFLQLREVSWNGACEALGVTVPFKWMGQTTENWIKDVKSRVAQVEISKKRKDLELLEDRVGKLVTAEQRREIEFEELTKLI